MLSRIARRAQATSAIKIADGVKNASVRLPHKEVTKEAQQAKLLAHGKFIMDALPKYVQDAQVTFGNELEIMICPTGVRPVMQFLKQNGLCQYNSISDLTALDVPTRVHRFEVVYNLLSVEYASRIRVKTYCDELSPIDSVADMHISADWYEREVYDMYGIYFHNHPDLRRILTDYGFHGHPLRKDFPLSGYYEVRYSHQHKRIVQEPVELAQEWRRFDLATPWENFPKFRPDVEQALPEPEEPKEDK